jgi:hypothetical protein
MSDAFAQVVAWENLQHFACRYRYVLRLDIVKHFP